MPYVLGLWLKEVPDHTVIYTRLMLIYMLIDSISGGLTTSVNATGRIIKYQLINSIITIITLPVAYLLLKAGFMSEVVYVVDIFIILCAQTARIIIVLPMINLSFIDYFKNVIYRIIPVAILAAIPSYYAFIHTNDDFGGLMIVGLCCFILVVFFVYTIGINRDERQMINKMIAEKIKK